MAALCGKGELAEPAQRLLSERRCRRGGYARTGYKSPVLSQGPIPRLAHGLIEYLAGALLIAAPFLFSFDSGSATALAIIVGVVVIVIAASTEGPSSLINSIPLAAHVALDYVLAAVLVAMPFIGGFSDETSPTVFFIALGIAHLLITIGTRFRRAAEPAGSDRVGAA